MDVVDELVEEKLHVVKEHQRRRVVHRYTCRCRACGERTTLRSLPAPCERSKVTCEWLAWLVYQKFWLLTPLDRTRRDLAERGVPIAMSTLTAPASSSASLPPAAPRASPRRRISPGLSRASVPTATSLRCRSRP